MSRSSILSFVIVSVGTGVLLATTAKSQLGAPKNVVVLQATTPGTAQSGHIHVTGAIRSGGFIGNGSLLGNLNWSALIGVPPGFADGIDDNTTYSNGPGLGLGGTTFFIASGGIVTSMIDDLAVTNSKIADVGWGKILGIPSAFPPGGIASGDLGGNFPAPVVTGLRGRNVTGAPPNTGDYLGWNGTTWGPGNEGGTLVNLNATALATGIVPNSRLLVGGDLAGPLSSATVGRLQGRTVSSSLPNTNEALLWTGTQWAPGVPTAGALTLPFSGSSSAPSAASFEATNTSSTGRGISGISTATFGTNYGGYFLSASPSGRSVYGLASGTAGQNFGGYFQSDGIAGRAIYGLASEGTGTNYGGYFDSNSIAGYGVYAISAGIYGVQGTSTHPSLTSYGGYFQSQSTSGRGVYAIATELTGVTYGGYFDSNSEQGYGVYGLSSGNEGGHFECSGTTLAKGVSGITTSLLGTTFGGYFESNSSSGYGMSAFSAGLYGVRGETTLGSGTTYGGYFRSSSTSGVGVMGYASAATGTIYGVKGQGNAAGYGVYAVGELGASGVKSFRIDHPSDPENKYLLHYSTESPFPQNFYSGNIVSDKDGYAWVELPTYFADINTNFKYQLTVISEDFVQAVVSKKIAGTQFQIRTSAPNTEVSWRVEADRNDLYVLAKQPKDVQNKLGRERGKYQHPELYGMGKEMGMDFDASHETLKSRPK